MFALGAVTHVQDGLELHPLLRDFLISKLEHLPDAEDRIHEAVSVALEMSAWDTAIKLIRRFDLADMIEHVLGEAYRPLLTSGRIGTLAEFDDHVRALGRRRFPALDLIAAELALRRGEFASAEQTATRVARQMDGSHKLLSHAHSIAGQAAFSTWEAPRAESHFQRALAAAISDDDESEAVWGLALTAIYGDTGHLSAAVAALKRRSDHSAVDMVRHTLAQLALARVGGGLKSVPNLEDALHVTRSIDDPHVRRASTARTLIQGPPNPLHGGCFDRSGSPKRCRRFSARLGRSPHLQWNLALAQLGLRQFSEADRSLRHVERYSADTEDPFHVLNARCLRARYWLTLNQPQRALDEVEQD